MDLILGTILVFALFTAAVARSKGRDFFGWLILGGLFPLISLIAVAAMPSKVGVLNARDAKQCPKCAEKVQREAAICRYCSNEFDLAAERATTRGADMSRLGLLVLAVLAIVAYAKFVG